MKKLVLVLFLSTGFSEFANATTYDCYLQRNWVSYPSQILTAEVDAASPTVVTIGTGESYSLKIYTSTYESNTYYHFEVTPSNDSQYENTYFSVVKEANDFVSFGTWPASNTSDFISFSCNKQ